MNVAVYAAITYFVGFGRVLVGFIPAACLHSVVLWYYFAVKTHEGYSTEAPETRSHDYYGRALYLLSFGLSLHKTSLKTESCLAPDRWRS